MAWSQRINYDKAVLTYKALNNLTPAYVSDLLTPTAIACNRNLRSTENGSLILTKTTMSLYIGPFTFSAPKLWNTFPTSVKQASSLNILNKKRNVPCIFEVCFLGMLMPFCEFYCIYKLREVFTVLKMNVTTEASKLMSED